MCFSIVIEVNTGEHFQQEYPTLEAARHVYDMIPTGAQIYGVWLYIGAEIEMAKFISVGTPQPHTINLWAEEIKDVTPMVRD